MELCWPRVELTKSSVPIHSAVEGELVPIEMETQHGKSVRCLAISSDNDLLLSGEHEGKVFISSVYAADCLTSSHYFQTVLYIRLLLFCSVYPIWLYTLLGHQSDLELFVNF